MPEMLVTSPDPVKKTVYDYDFTLTGGMALPVTVDTDLGDSVTFTDPLVIINLTAKPSQTQPNQILPAEIIHLYTAHIISVQRRAREIVEQTPEQRSEWSKILAASVQ